MNITNILQGEEDSLFLTLFDTNLIQNIFIKLFKKYNYKLQNKSYYTKNQSSDQEEDYKNYFSKMNNFGLVCKLFNYVSNQTLFNVNICNVKFQIPYTLYLKLSFVENDDQKYYQEPNIDIILKYTCEYGFYDTIQTLIEIGKANINNTAGLFSDTPLSEATSFNNIQTVKELFKYENLDINLKKPFIEACTKGFEVIIELFLSRDDLELNIQNTKGFTGLICASLQNQENIVSLLLSRNDLNLNIQDKNGLTALMNATKCNYENIVSLLLSRNDLNLNIQDKNGLTALMNVAENDNENIVSLLLSRNDLNLNIQDDQGFTALMYAAKYSNENIVSLLISQKNRININLKDNNQKTALHHAKEGKIKI